jgi:AcrR family transcriptional regulator
MPRHDPSEKTKTEIIRVAVRFVEEKGWDEVRVEDVVKEVGVTRGAFYHYFKSREELIAAVTDYFYLEHNPFVIAMKQEGLTALEKFRYALKANVRFNLENSELSNAVVLGMSSPAVFRSEFYSQVNTTAPYIERLLVEGNEDGSIAVCYPKQAAQVFIMLSSMWINPAVFRVSYQEFCDKVSFAEHLCERIGVPVVNDEVRDLLVQLHKNFTQEP